MFSPSAVFKGWWGPARGVIVAGVAAFFLWSLSRFVFAENYRAQTGFLPFDLQFPLTQFMIGIELGAFKRGTATSAYVAFVAANLAYIVALAWFFTALWMWIFTKQPNRVFHFLTRGGILMMPTYIVVMDIAAKVCFYMIVEGHRTDLYADIVAVAVTIHRLKFAVIDIRDYLTLGFLAAAALSILHKRRTQNP